MKSYSRCLLTTAALSIGALLYAQESAAFVPVPRIEVAAVASKGVYAPGDTVLIALRLKIPERYHLFDNPKGPGFGKPMTYAASGDPDVVWRDLLKTKSRRYKAEIGGWYKGFEGEACFFLRGTVKPDAVPEAYSGTVKISGLICAEACHPVDTNLKIALTIGKTSSASKPFAADARLERLLMKATISQALEAQHPDISSIEKIAQGNGAQESEAIPAWKYTPQQADADLNIWAAIFFAFIAGIILNAMPCVLPVLGIKILSFAQGQDGGRKKAVMHSLTFSAGVISVFLLLAGLAAYANYSWGRQFQDPKALIAIVTLIVVFALGMFNVYVITLPGPVSGINARGGSHGMADDFLKGIFATVLATPCSGPFLGAVLAWSVLQPPPVIFAVYGCIGAGMSFPYVLLSMSRRLTGMLPKPGPWMNDFKALMGFLLLGFGVYLILGLPDDYIVPTVLFCVTTSLAVAVYGRFAPWGSAAGRRIVSLVAALFIAAAGFCISFMAVYPAFSEAAAEKVAEEDEVWQKFSADSLLKANTEGRHAIVDFTANWCMNCQYNYLMVLTKKEVTGLIRQKNVLALKVDMTMPDPVQDSLLHALGSRSIPFLAVFPGDNPTRPVVMRDVLTKGRVTEALRRLE